MSIKKFLTRLFRRRLDKIPVGGVLDGRYRPAYDRAPYMSQPSALKRIEDGMERVIREFAMAGIHMREDMRSLSPGMRVVTFEGNMLVEAFAKPLFGAYGTQWFLVRGNRTIACAFSVGAFLEEASKAL